MLCLDFNKAFDCYQYRKYCTFLFNLNKRALISQKSHKPDINCFNKCIECQLYFKIKKLFLLIFITNKQPHILLIWFFNPILTLRGHFNIYDFFNLTCPKIKIFTPLFWFCMKNEARARFSVVARLNNIDILF